MYFSLTKTMEIIKIHFGHIRSENMPLVLNSPVTFVLGSALCLLLYLIVNILKETLKLVHSAYANRDKGTINL